MRDPYLLDPTCLAAKPLVFEGSFRPADLERLEDAIAGDEGELRYRIEAGLDPRRRKVVWCIIEGFVFLTCQTTLDAFRHDLAIRETLVLVDDESHLPPMEEESESEDYLVAAEPLDIRDLVEDAVLLALPMMPRKPGLEGAKGGVEEALPKESPFAALAGLKKPT